MGVLTFAPLMARRLGLALAMAIALCNGAVDAGNTVVADELGTIFFNPAGLTEIWRDVDPADEKTRVERHVSHDLGHPVMKTIASLSNAEIAHRLVRNGGEQVRERRTADRSISARDLGRVCRFLARRRDQEHCPPGSQSGPDMPPVDRRAGRVFDGRQRHAAEFAAR